MLLQLEKTKPYLPGKALSASELKQLITKSRKSGIVSLAKAHQTIRRKITK